MIRATDGGLGYVVVAAPLDPNRGGRQSRRSSREGNDHPLLSTKDLVGIELDVPAPEGQAQSEQTARPPRRLAAAQEALDKALDHLGFAELQLAYA